MHRSAAARKHLALKALAIGLALLSLGLCLGRPAAGATAAETARYQKLAPVFDNAYAAHPEVPRGILEAVSYRNTFFHHLQPAGAPAEDGGPDAQAYGLMGLISDASGLFTSTLEEVAALSGLSVEAIQSDPQTNVLAFAGAYAARRAQLGITSANVADQLPVLISLSGFPESIPGVSFPLDHYVYSVVEFLNSPEYQSLCGLPAYAIDLAAIFKPERLLLLRGGSATLATTGGAQLATAQSGDDPGATWMPAGCDEVKTFDRSGGPSHVAIHATDSSFERALQRYLNCNRQESPHYLISREGTVVQLVLEARGSFHMDNLETNRMAIGIAHEGMSELGDFGGSIGASAGLVQRMAARNGFDTTRMYSELGSGTGGAFALPDCIQIKGHDHFAGQSRQDPGPFWPWASYYQAVNGTPPPAGGLVCPPEAATACSGFVTDDNASPLGNGFYADDRRNVLTIQAPAGAAKVQLDFARFSLASGDWLYVYDGACTDPGRLLGAWSDGQHWTSSATPGAPFAPPGTIVSTGPQLTIETRADCAIGAAGFEAIWTSLEENGDPFCCPTPRHFRVSERRERGVTLTWDAVEGAQQYEVWWRRSFDFDWTGPRTFSANVAVIDGLEPGTTYELRLRSLCGGTNFSPFTFRTTSTCRADGLGADPCLECRPPGNLRDTKVTVSTAKVAWDEVTGASGYRVKYRKVFPLPPGENPVDWQQAPSVETTDTNVVIRNLDESSTYQYIVQTLCSTTVSSDFSPPDEFTTDFCQSPGFIFGGGSFEVIWEDYTSARLRWRDVDDAERYIFQYRRTPDPAEDPNLDPDWLTAVQQTVPPDPVDDKVGHDVFQLLPDKSYQARVKTVCPGENESGWSQVLDFVTECRAPGKRHGEAIPPPTVTPQANSALVEWGETEIRLYEIEHKEKSATAWIPDGRAGNITTHLLEDLTTGHDYNVRVRTVCSEQHTSPWAEAEFMTPCEPPSNLRLLESGTNFLEVKWTPLKADRTKVLWKPRSESQFDSDRILSENSSYLLTHWFDEGGLRRCADYDLQLKSVCPRGDSADNSGIFKTQCPCENSMIFHGKDADGTRCSLFFLLNARTWNGFFGNFDVRWATETRLLNDWQIEMRECIGTCSGNFTDLGNVRKRAKDKSCLARRHTDYYADQQPLLTLGHVYEFRARYLCDNGLWSNWVNEALEIVLVPNAAVTAATATSLTVGWDPVPGALGYMVSYGLPDEETPNEIALGAEARSAVIPGLLGEQLYEIEVQAQLPDGLSTPILLEAVPQAPACTYSLDPAGANVPPGGATGNAIAVSTQAGCAWSAHSDSPWIIVTAGQGIGGGAVVYDVAPNASGGVRSGTITVAGQTFFVSQEACPIQLQPAERSFSYTSDSDVLNVSAAGGCAWTAVAGAPWITINGNASGTGSGTVSYSVATNTATTWPVSRAGSITVGGQSLIVNQAGQPGCEIAQGLSCDALGLSGCSTGCFTSDGGSKTVYVWLSRTDCDWTPRSDSPWVRITSVNDPGSNPRTFTYAVDPTASPETRVGGIFTNGLQHRVTQGGTSSAASGRVTDAAGRGIAGVTLTFEALIFYGGAPIPGPVTTDVEGNWSQVGFLPCKANFATASLAGHTFSPSRRFFNPGSSGNDFSSGTATGGAGGGGGTACSGTIAPGGASVGGSGAAGSSVAVSAGCAWTAASGAPWVTVVSGASGTGTGTVVYSVAANPGPSPRTAVVTIAGQSFVVIQEAASPCPYTFSPASQFLPGVLAGGSVDVSVPSLCTWTAVSDAPWITVLGGASGTGNGTVVYEAAANPTTTPRAGTLTIGGQAFTVTQGGAPCTFGVSPASQSVGAGGGSGSAGVTSPGGCAWSATSNASWILLSGADNGGTVAGSGNGTVGFSVAANASPVARAGTLTIAGKTFTVNQAAMACGFALTPTSQSAPGGAATGSVGVTATAGCSWSAVSNAAWTTVTAGASGTGNGTVAWSVAANPTTSARTGTLTIGGQVFTVNQAASATLPAAPTGLTANAISPTQIQLVWADNSGNETGFSVERRSGGNSGFTVVATVGADVTTYTNSGLPQSTAYTYRVRATNAAGASGYSNEATATTLASAPPAAPGDLAAATSQSAFGIDVWWSDNSTNEISFRLEKRRSDAATFVEIASLEAGTLGYFDIDVQPGVTYAYRVRACNSAGCSAYSFEAWITYTP